LAKKDLKRVFALIGAILFLAPALHAQEKCPVEVKFLLSPPTTQAVIASLGFEGETTGRVYFFDTDALDLSMQGVILRVRQGTKNDLTVKLRLPKGNQQVDNSRLRERFPCEIDRTRSGAVTSYAVGRRYKAAKEPELGSDIYRLLSASQIKLLNEARVSVDWARVMRVANIKSTNWETTAQSPYGRLALELWEWPGGKILELSAKAGPEAEESKYAELERLVRMKYLSLSASQDTKTSLALRTLADHVSPPR
jgi:CYTH domain